MSKWQGFLVNFVATLAIWLGVAIMDGVSRAGSNDVFDFALLAAFGTTIALWVIWALTPPAEKKESPDEKAKRTATEHDSRLALLLSLMDEDERQSLKRRLAEELDADGEAVTLAQLLAAQDDHNRRAG